MNAKRSTKRALALTTTLCMLTALVPSAYAAETAQADTYILLSNEGIMTGSSESSLSAVSTDSTDAVYTAHDIIYYSETCEGEGTGADIHTAAEADANTVLHITEAGTYHVSGELSAGQLFIDLGEDAADDPTAVVTLILDDVDITCDVAPAVLFYSVYECGPDTMDSTTAQALDTSAAGANVILADGTVNNVTGSYVAKIYQTGTTKKLYKFDGAFYSKMTMNVDGGTLGTGVLNIIAENEGLDSELHLTINGGTINIYAQNDGINTNEDNVSVTTVNDGNLHIVAGLGAEGDGVDSNGYLVINGGTVISAANPGADSGLDSDCGSYVNGGTVVALGSTMDWAETDSQQVTVNLQFSQSKSAGDAIVFTDTDGEVVFAYDPGEDEVTGSHVRTYQGAVISSDTLTVGETYYVYIGGTVTGTEVQGVYDADSVTDYSGGTRQAYTGTDVGGVFGGGGQGGTPPTDAGGTPPTDAGGTPPTDAGGTPPTDAGGTPPTGESGTTGDASIYFYLTDFVNAFSGVTDADSQEETTPPAEPTQPTELPFTDVSEDAWYYDNVSYVYQSGLMTGMTDTLFLPETTLSRAMLATVLYRMAGSPAVTGTTPFSDVSSDQWYADAVLWANQNGIVLGNDDGTFAPDNNVTREQMAAMLYRYASYLGLDVSAVDSLSAFTDAAAVSNYAVSAVGWAVQNSIIQGMTPIQLAPSGSATRAQTAAVLQRLCALIAA